MAAYFYEFRKKLYYSFTFTDLTYDQGYVTDVYILVW